MSAECKNVQKQKGIIMIVISQHETRNILTVMTESSSQRDVAEQLGVHHNTVYRWLHCDEIPRIAALAIKALNRDNQGRG
jgi:IS30 family transposase